VSTSLVALCLFAGWTLLLVTSLALFRGLFSTRSGKALNSFSPDGTDVPGFGQRLTRAHLNCLETLPVAGAVILAAAVAGRGDVTDPLAMPLLYARVTQSIVHMISVSVPMVLLRAGLLVVQIGILASWILRLAF
jgi:uncharacterized MAPEG superfamily protein